MLSNLLTGGLMERLYSIPAILIALAFHEWAHAYSAYRLGDPTAYNMGRMTINPFSHIDLVGFLMLFLVHFGWAKPVPVNTRNFKTPRRDEIIVSLAGVTTNLILAFLGMGVFFIVIYVLKSGNGALNAMLAYFITINLGLCIFNLLPIPPLDGYRVAACLLIRRVGYKPFEYLERYGFIILVVLLLTRILSSIMSFAVSAVMSGMMAVYSGLFSLIGLI